MKHKFYDIKNVNLNFSAGVTAVFRMEDGSMKRFTRNVEGSSSGYRINGEVRSNVKLSEV